MSVTLQTASGTNVIFDLVKANGDGQVFQNIGTSFADTKVLTAGLRIGKTGTAKAKTGFKYTYSYTNEQGVLKRGVAFFSCEGTVPEDMPIAEADKAVYMLGTLAVHALFKDLASKRRYSQS